jgi:hypothetical protein
MTQLLYGSLLTTVQINFFSLAAAKLGGLLLEVLLSVIFVSVLLTFTLAFKVWLQ